MSGRSFGQKSTQEITPQSEITINASVSPLLYKNRREVSIKDVMGHMNPPSNKTEMHVATNELAMAYKNAPGFGGTRSIFTNEIFTSFNGISTRGYGSQDQFESQFRFVGFTNSPVYFENDVTTNEGSAIRIRGSGTIPVNYSTETFYPGQKVGWRLHSINPQIRQAEIAARSANKDAPAPSKLVAIPTVITYEQLAKWWEDITLHLTEKNHTGRYDIQNYIRDIKHGRFDRSHINEVSTSTKATQLLYGFNLVATLLELGWITSSYKSNKSGDAKSATNFVPSRSFVNSQAFKYSIKNVTAGSWEKFGVNVNSSTGNALPNVIQLSDLEVTHRKNHVSDFLEYLAGNLGLVHDPRRSWLSEDHKLTKNVLLRNNFSNITNPRLYAATKKILEKDFVDSARKLDSFGKEINSSTIAGQVYDLQSSMAEIHWKTVGKIIDFKDSKVIANSSSVSRPNEPLHYYI